jgi:Tfp pilus assembly protein PilF
MEAHLPPPKGPSKGLPQGSIELQAIDVEPLQPDDLQAAGCGPGSPPKRAAAKPRRLLAVQAFAGGLLLSFLGGLLGLQMLSPPRPSIARSSPQAGLALTAPTQPSTEPEPLLLPIPSPPKQLPMLDPTGLTVQQVQALCEAGGAAAVPRLAPVLLQAAAFDALEACLRPLERPQVLASAPASQRDALFDWAVRRRLAQGDWGAATATATERLKGARVAPRAYADVVRLHAWAGHPPTADGVLREGVARFSGPGASAGRAELIYYALQQALTQHDLAAAQRAMEAAHGLHGRRTAGWLPLAQGSFAAAQGRPRVAAWRFRQARRAGRPEAHFALSLLQVDGSEGPPLAARRSAALVDHNPQAALALAHAEAAAGHPGRAATAYQMAIWHDPLAADPRQTFAAWLSCLAASGQTMDAGARAEHSVQANNADPHALQTWLQIVRPRTSPAALALRLQTLRTTYPNQPAVTAALAEAYVDAGQPQRAIQVGESLACQEGGAHHPELLYTLGRAYKGQDNRRASTYLQRAAIAQPRAPVFYELARAELRQNCPVAATAALQQALRLEPQHVDTHRLLGAMALREGRLDAGIDHVLRAAQAAGTTDPASLQEGLGDVLCDHALPAPAAAAYRRAVDLHRSSPSARQIRVSLKLAKLELGPLGQPKSARQRLRQVVAQAPQHAEAHLLLASAYEALGEVRAASVARRRAARLRVD